MNPSLYPDLSTERLKQLLEDCTQGDWRLSTLKDGTALGVSHPTEKGISIANITDEYVPAEGFIERRDERQANAELLASSKALAEEVCLLRQALSQALPYLQNEKERISGATATYTAKEGALDSLILAFRGFLIPHIALSTSKKEPKP